MTYTTPKTERYMKALDHLRSAYMHVQAEVAEGQQTEKESMLLKSAMSNLSTALSRMEALHEMVKKKMHY